LRAARTAASSGKNAGSVVEGERRLEPGEELVPADHRQLGVGRVVQVEEVDRVEAEVLPASLELVLEIRGAHRVAAVDDILRIEDAGPQDLLGDPPLGRAAGFAVRREVAVLGRDEDGLPGQFPLLHDPSNGPTDRALRALVPVVDRGVEGVHPAGREADGHRLLHGEVGRSVRRTDVCTEPDRGDREVSRGGPEMVERDRPLGDRAVAESGRGFRRGPSRKPHRRRTVRDPKRRRYRGCGNAAFAMLKCDR